MGQTEKNSVRVYLFRIASNLGLSMGALTTACGRISIAHWS